MTEILLLASIVLGVLLYDTRRRLVRLEARVAEHRMAAAWEGEAARTAQVSEPELAPRPDVAAEPAFQAEPVAEAAVIPEVRMFESEPEPAFTEVVDLSEPAGAPTPTGFGFEDLFGRKLPIWAGGITLIVAAVLMVKYSIDTGLLSPVVRVVLGLVFGGALIGLGEWARVREDFVRDPRVSQALAGAGVGGLYAATLAAANLYDLVGPGLAFAGLAAITALAIGLALRFGAPCAVLGLIGGLATPALVQSDSPSVPLLAAYLAIVIGAITLLSRRQRWVWLGVGALTGGAGWSLLTIAMGDLDGAATLSIGLLVVLLGLALPAFAAEGRTAPVLRAVTAVAGALQLGLLVATGNFAPLTWGLYGLLSLAFVWLAGRTPILRRTVPVPLLTALGLAAAWPAPDAGWFAAVVAGTVAIYGGYALRHLWREAGGLVEVGMLAATALGGYAISLAQFYAGAAGQDLHFALLALGFAALPALGAGLGWRRDARGGDARFALLASCAGVLVVLAGLVGLPEWSAPITIALVAAGLLELAVAARDERLKNGVLGFLGVAVLALAVSVEAGGAELTRLTHAAMLTEPGRAVLRWSVVALVAAVFAWRRAGTVLRLGLQPLAVLLGYGLAAQVVPAPWLAVATAAALAALAEANGRKPALALAPALAACAAVLALWAFEPLAYWLLAALLSLGADPVLATDLPGPFTAARRLVAPAFALAFALWRGRESMPARLRIVGTAVAGGLGLVGVHVLYKQVFLIADTAAFVRLGLAERCLWEAALVGAGLAAWRWLERRELALGLVAAGLGHALVYTLVLHDPLWGAQAVGSWPLANLLVPAFGIAFAAPGLLARIAPDHAPRIQRPADAVRMAAIALFAFATLRQAFAGSLLVGGEVGEVENIGRSVLAIALALGFLGWGIRRALRDWRIASLALMLGAVGKVFVFDASGLEGLLRIVSFLALGFSLIGIGWLYSRYLKA